VPVARACEAIARDGYPDTLADIAAYYYNTDLRDADPSSGTGTCTSKDGNDLCDNNVPSNGLDVATNQHMTTFTLGLGAQGYMAYSPTYWTDTSGDFYDVKMGTVANPNSGFCSWEKSGSICNWPKPSEDSPANIDDLWHAAINGRGAYYSAADPASLADGLTNTLTIIVNTPRPGTAAAAASSNPNITSSDNYVFSSSYKSVEWFGELIRQQLEENARLTSPQWSARRLLDCSTAPWKANASYAHGSSFNRAGDCYTVKSEYSSGAAFGATDQASTELIPGAPVTRKIYTNGSGSLMEFNWANISGSNTLKSYFTKPAIAANPATGEGLSQFCQNLLTCLSADQQDKTTIATGGAAGEALVNFLRGDRSYEGSYFRSRTHV